MDFNDSSVTLSAQSIGRATPRAQVFANALAEKLKELEVAVNSANYCYERNPRNFAYAMSDAQRIVDESRELTTRWTQYLQTITT